MVQLDPSKIKVLPNNDSILVRHISKQLDENTAGLIVVRNKGNQARFFSVGQVISAPDKCYNPDGVGYDFSKIRDNKSYILYDARSSKFEFEWLGETYRIIRAWDVHIELPDYIESGEEKK